AARVEGVFAAEESLHVSRARARGIEVRFIKWVFGRCAFHGNTGRTIPGIRSSNVACLQTPFGRRYRECEARCGFERYKAWSIQSVRALHRCEDVRPHKNSRTIAWPPKYLEAGMARSGRHG